MQEGGGGKGADRATGQRRERRRKQGKRAEAGKKAQTGGKRADTQTGGGAGEGREVREVRLGEVAAASRAGERTDSRSALSTRCRERGAERVKARGKNRTVDLAGDDHRELLPHEVLDLLGGHAVPRRLQPQRLLADHLAVDRPHERLPAHRRPEPQLEAEALADFKK